MYQNEYIYVYLAWFLQNKYSVGLVCTHYATEHGKTLTSVEEKAVKEVLATAKRKYEYTKEIPKKWISELAETLYYITQ